MRKMYKALEIINNKLVSLKEKCIFGINYSGMHDSAFSLILPSGEIIYAISLERLSRCKHDGRPLYDILKFINWECISTVVISTEEKLNIVNTEDSKVFLSKLPYERDGKTLHHRQEFYDFLSNIPCNVKFMNHELSHAASAFFGSGFDEAICICYDGGMLNEQWFGGIFHCSKSNGIQTLEYFDAVKYPKVATLYAFVTALLGFKPLSHEGKLTGLAALGKPSKKLNSILEKWFTKDYFHIEKCLVWINEYNAVCSAELVPNTLEIQKYRDQVLEFTKEDIASTLQNFTENHILSILSKCDENGWMKNNICLAGGLFANVRLNQRILEFGFDNIFIAPPMGDEGTSLGAAFLEASNHKNFIYKSYKHMYYGIDDLKEINTKYLDNLKIVFNIYENIELKIAELLSSGKIVSIFQGNSEFGPRALGNCSILATTTNTNINDYLNARLGRTEFMPFAPVTRIDDMSDCYYNYEKALEATRFMTITLDCTELMKDLCPAVVHIDGTARPQMIDDETNPLIYNILTQYKILTGRPSLVNTSFNVHEEPIVSSIEDALKGFFESGLDYLYIKNVGLISYDENNAIALKYLNKRIKNKQTNCKSDYFINSYFEGLKNFEKSNTDLIDRTQRLEDTTVELEQLRIDLIDRTQRLEDTIAELDKYKQSKLVVNGKVIA